ncbi:LysR family transcriptional regulator [Lysinibacillus sphaericus]|uniref:Transcriptional regulator n=1 Tax=Lysinibacillus sphaericus OT4b.31 TaxID=1285586 RepID=R7ZGA0_LYSSH|nr:LysR family transcriptional regulator [Lysinibacillus sphaericus]EON73083.1 transcriptional regulator [Lysinibacillus sphaericus OT4b.31]
MNLHALRIFTNVARLGSITAAANELLLSQPAVTIQIRNLEKELNLKLIKNKGRGIQLTTEGQYIYEQGQRLFYLEEQMAEKIKVFITKEEKIQIASSYIPINYVLPPYIAEYKLMKPNVNFFVSLGNVKYVEEKILNYQADFGFLVQSNLGHENLNFEKILEIEFYFVVHPLHKLANQTVPLNTLSKEEIIYREQGSATLDLLEAIFYTYDCPVPKMGLQMQGLHESIKVVEAGYGIMLAPSISVTSSIENQKLARIYVDGINIKQSLFICTRKNETIEHPFIQYLKENLDVK